MEYLEFRKIIVKNKNENIYYNDNIEFYIVPKNLHDVSVRFGSNEPSKLEYYPFKTSVKVSTNKNGKTVTDFGVGFPDPNKFKFFFDRAEAEAHTVVLMTRQRVGLITALESFDKKTNYKQRFEASMESFPEIFI